MKGPIVGLMKVWEADWGLTAFLVLLVVFVFVLNPLVAASIQGQLITSLLYSLVLISGVFSVTGNPVAKFVVIVLAVVTIFLRWLQHVVPGTDIVSMSALSSLLFLGLLSGVVLLEVFKKGPITVHRIQGAVAVYLLLGLIWAFAYDLVALQIPGSFQAAESTLPHSTLVYFSFTTLTTVGYGDINPVHPLARSLANLEGLVGQLFPVILIARLVGMELESRLRRQGP
ncbi:MAG: potassium channel family protein [Nitrospiraceae bacterium]